MEILEAVRLRKSVRGYRPDPVPREILEEILRIASRSPSANNTQPWEFAVLAGKALDDIRRGNMEKLASGAKPNPDLVIRPYEGIYRQRQVNLAIQIFQLMGIAREDQEKRAQWLRRGFRFFDAPAAILILADKSLDGTWLIFDVGALAQTICLVALNYGLGTCIEGQGIMFPEVVRKVTGIPEAKRIIIGIAIGYPDWHFPANKLHSEREPIENLTTWYGF